jgi:DNA-binding NtrC family response regulator
VDLRQVLTTGFTLVGLEELRPLDPVSPQLEGNIETVVRRSEARLIFLVGAGSIEDYKICLRALQKAAPAVPVIAAVEGLEADQTFELLNIGAADFIIPPFNAKDILPRAWRVVTQLSADTENAPAAEDSPTKQLIGESASFRSAADKIPLIAGCDANVLIVGETGTGKELYARAIHYSSARAGQPFMPVNCGAIPVELVENELFGHTRGAYTGANSLQVGLIEEANRGTLFLDEIDCLPIFAQVKLLRFLQEKEYRPLGSPKMRHANVRVIAASNINLPEAVDNGRVRQDLFYRLNIISLTLPPLRERREDITLLARHFLARYSRESGKRVTNFSEEALHLLLVHLWPGNVRELEHVIERAVVLCQGEIIQASDVLVTHSPFEARESLQQAKAREIARFEKNYIQGVLAACSGNITRAAEVARKNRRAFWQLIQKHQIDVQQFKRSTT